MSEPGDVLSMAEMAVALGRSTQSVRLFIRYEGLPARKKGNQWIALRGDLEEWAARPEVDAMLRKGDAILRQTGRHGGAGSLARSI